MSIMSKDEEGGCKLSSACKHKERKPKKPHYIPRPWGKPYNYKCFQCPFTCMEKSHLYNHMKYSLCKNSLSLLIESDWPYKKNNFLIPETHLLQEPQPESSLGRQDVCDSTGSNTTKARQAGEKDPAEVQSFLDEEDEKEEEEEEETGEVLKDKGKGLTSLQASPSKSEANISMAGMKGKKERSSKEGEPDFIITDVFSLEGQFEKEREEPKFTKVSRKTASNVGGTRAEQWKLLTGTLKKGTTEVPPGTNTIPCYPPPTYTDYQEQQGLSLLGINYPLNTNLFSYLNPAMTGGTAQFPFLASTAQLMHPTHSTHFQSLQNTERPSFIPRFYYPLLFEHAFNSAESKVISGKPVSQAQPGPTSYVSVPRTKMPMEPTKACLHKAPEDKNTVSWVSSDKLSKQTSSHNKLIQDNDGKWPSQAARDAIQQQKQILGVYGAPTLNMNEGLIPQKGTTDEAVWTNTSPVRCMKRKPWLEKDVPNVATDKTPLIVGGERPTPNRSCSPSIPSPDPWHDKKPNLERSTQKRKRESEATNNVDPMSENTSALIGDLSRTLEEYGKVERRLANLASEDNSRQKALSEQLGKIRLELLNIHRALEKVSCSHEGPLDLSIKRSEDTGKEEVDKSPPEDDLATHPPSDCPPRQLVKVELLPPDLATCYARPTKCEADSSVLLCPDGRIGGAGVVQPQVSILEEGGGSRLGFGRGQQQLEGV
ncbi:proline-rich protein 35 [Spea bombifrons]|uniref:proline-rich protein 35 n=1 Tax=Spea bombifrons TaxID=233779 RepID=UPI0023493EF4|nr:proline-rich protein 35 [Spea bombifrons]